MKNRIYWYIIYGLIIAGLLQWFGWISPLFIRQSVRQEYGICEIYSLIDCFNDKGDFKKVPILRRRFIIDIKKNEYKLVKYYKLERVK